MPSSRRTQLSPTCTTSKTTFEEIIHSTTRSQRIALTSLDLEIGAVDIHVLDAAAGFKLVLLGSLEGRALQS